MQELIERLERAIGPDRELDAEIAKAVGHRHGPFERVHVESRSYEVHEEIASYYTKSLDAALTLVPKENWWEVKQVCSPTSPMRSFGRAGLFMAATHHNYGESGIAGSHDSPAIALCLAALRARSL